ncbi:J domain-containing protein required for chloroplast accumulation response 1 isoform X2 [Prosopis cineraria]|uniref:J domain-containing protein required for chloroplast accumulation response 1 isoform X2 n=1 Tax=Prosopis cineraria TaxID=364024 RepID=UPI00240F1E2A|nr:J domain-containing protein required for chloroplast accumulation response 1 isoform X2 [Prosopis cineraria]
MEEDASWCAWPRVREKPVFGEDYLNRRRYANDNFYDDIFGGDESPCRTPIKHERHPFSSTPGSRILSPVPPLPPAPDSISPSSLPSTLSLPAKLTKGTDLPTFGSPARSLRMSNKDAASNGLSSSDSPATHLSRFSSHTTRGMEESKNGSGTMRPSRSSQEISDLSISDKADKGGDSAGQFHFSIYKWASKGVVPLLMPLRTERNSRTKENVKLERCSSTKDWMVRESTSQNDNSLAYTVSSSLKNRRQDRSTTFVTPQNGSDTLEERASAKRNLTTLSTLQNIIKDVPGSSLSSDTRAESSICSVSGREFSGKMKEDLVQTIKTQRVESKSSHSLISKSDDTQDYTEKTKMEKGIESKTPKSSAIRDISTTWKRQVEKTADLNGVEGSKATLQSMENVKVKGKVKEFVRIFSQEAVTKPRVGTKSSEYKLRSALRTTEEAEDNPQILKKVDSATEITNTSGDNLFRQDDISASEILDSTVAVEDGFFHGNFRVRELAQDDNEVFQTQNNQEIKVIDDKIRQWSNGKQGNIRSLLSTLQYVLWPDSGWKPLPLVDIIEGNAVKRAYQRALLCLHPDKLQQKGAASHQKYIAEKVFDILQEAWTHFNMLGAL